MCATVQAVTELPNYGKLPVRGSEKSNVDQSQEHCTRGRARARTARASEDPFAVAASLVTATIGSRSRGSGNPILFVQVPVPFRFQPSTHATFNCSPWQARGSATCRGSLACRLRGRARGDDAHGGRGDRSGSSSPTWELRSRRARAAVRLRAGRTGGSDVCERVQRIWVCTEQPARNSTPGEAAGSLAR